MAAALETQTLDEANLLGTAISPGVEPQQLVLALLRTSAAEQGLFHINGVQNGIAVSRPPLFREDDTWLLSALHKRGIPYTPARSGDGWVGEAGGSVH